MRTIRYMLLTLVLLISSTTVRAQFNYTLPPEPNAYYTLTVLSDPAEASTVSGTGAYYAGTNVGVRTTATDTKWVFQNWTDKDGVVISSATSFTYNVPVGGNVLTAHWAEVSTATITLSSQPAHGGSTSGAGLYREGTQVTLKASNAKDFKFIDWRDEEGHIVSTTSSFTYTTGAEDVHYIAYFDFAPGTPAEPNQTKAKHRVWFTADPPEGGRFNRTSGADQVTEGSSLSITASPATYYVFDNWTCGEEVYSTSNTISVAMGTEDIHLVAHFHYDFDPARPIEPGSDTRTHYQLYAYSQSFYKGGSVWLPFYLENTGTVTAMTFKALVPRNLVVGEPRTTSRTSGYTITTTSEDVDDDFVRYTFTLDGGTEFADVNGKVMELPITAAEGVLAADCRIVLEDGLVTTANGTQVLSMRDGFVDVLFDESNLHASFAFDRSMYRVQFTDQSLGATRIEWNFGDGTTSTEPNPLHFYEKAGTYNVRLTIWGVAADDVAEQAIVVNPPSAWTASGDYTINESIEALRNFISTDEMLTLLSQCKVTGDVGITLQGGADYQLAVTDSLSLARLTTLTTSLSTNTLSFMAPADAPATFNIVTDGTEAAKKSAFDFLLHTTTQNVKTMIDGETFSLSILTSDTAQGIETRTSSKGVPYSSACIGNSIVVTWTRTSQSSFISGALESGTGDLPPMTLVSSQRSVGSVLYTITASMDGLVIATCTHEIFVHPVATMYPDEMQSLAALYTATSGDSWTHKWNIDDSTIDGNWEGVTFDVDGHVTALNLSAFGLTGTLPAEGFTLPLLTSLNLSGNAITTIPAGFLDGCSSLTSLNLSNNAIASLSEGAFADCPTLTTLNLNRNYLTSLDEPLPATITTLDLGNQCADSRIEDMTVQEWVLAANVEDVEQGSLLAYDHAAQAFTAHPTLYLTSVVGNRSVGMLVWNGNNYTLTLTTDYSLADGNLVKAASSNGVAAGSFVCGAFHFLMGDANFDQSVDVLDAQLTLNDILGTRSALWNLTAADTFDDEIINIMDVIATVDIFIAEEQPSEAALLRKPVTGLGIDENIIYQAGGSVMMKSNTPVAALDLTIEGVSASQIGLRLPSNEFSLITRNTSSGVRAVILSPVGSVIPAGEVVLLRMSGEGEPVTVLAADADAQVVPMRCTLNPTDIQRMNADDSDNDILYDLQGRKVENPQKGIYIINGSKKIIR